MPAGGDGAFIRKGAGDRQPNSGYKKPAFWIILIAVIACIVLAICLMTNPSSSKSLSEKLGASMDKAISERYHRYEAERFYATWDYDVLRVNPQIGRQFMHG